MQDTSPLDPPPPADAHGHEAERRHEQLRQLSSEVQQVVRESHRLIDEHRAAAQRMERTIVEARIRLVRAQSEARALTREHESAGSVTMDLPTFHKSLHPPVSLPELPPRGEP